MFAHTVENTILNLGGQHHFMTCLISPFFIFISPPRFALMSPQTKMTFLAQEKPQSCSPLSAGGLPLICSRSASSCTSRSCFHLLFDSLSQNSNLPLFFYSCKSIKNKFYFLFFYSLYTLNLYSTWILCHLNIVIVEYTLKYTAISFFYSVFCT